MSKYTFTYLHHSLHNTNIPHNSAHNAQHSAERWLMQFQFVIYNFTYNSVNPRHNSCFFVQVNYKYPNPNPTKH